MINLCHGKYDPQKSDWRAIEVLSEGYLMGRMNKFTLLITVVAGIIDSKFYRYDFKKG